jgi:hypothetical protein
LTAKGKAAFWSHKDWHEKIDGEFTHDMKSFPESNIDVILNFMTKIEAFLTHRFESDA